MANLSFFLFPCALGTLLFTLFARTSQACTLTAPDPAVGITYGVHFDLFWDNCTTRGTIQLWSQNTGGEDKQLNEYSVTRSPIPWAISNIGFIYLTVYFVLVDHDGLKATSPTYVIQPGPQIGSLLSASPSALSRISVISESIASISSQSGNGSTTSSDTVTTITTNRLLPSTSHFPSNTGSSSASSPTSVPTRLASPLESGSFDHIAIIASSTIGAVALVALIVLGYWGWKRSRPPPYTPACG